MTNYLAQAARGSSGVLGSFTVGKEQQEHKVDGHAVCTAREQGDDSGAQVTFSSLFVSDPSTWDCAIHIQSRFSLLSYTFLESP